MGISNLLYLAQMTERVPILPPFAGFRDQWQAGILSFFTIPLKLGWYSFPGFIPFGEIFDVPRLREALHMPIIEWRDVKDLAAGSKQPPEPLGCWSVWAPYDGNQRPRGNFITGDSQLSLGPLVFLHPASFVPVSYHIFATISFRSLVYSRNGSCKAHGHEWTPRATCKSQQASYP